MDEHKHYYVWINFYYQEVVLSTYLNALTKEEKDNSYLLGRVITPDNEVIPLHDKKNIPNNIDFCSQENARLQLEDEYYIFFKRDNGFNLVDNYERFLIE